MALNKWIVTTRRNPCPICNKFGWCILSPDGCMAICNRIESPHPSKGGGWIHRIKDNPDRPFIPAPQKRRSDASQTLDLNSYMEKARNALTPSLAASLAASLHLPLAAISPLTPGHSSFDNAATFPMRDSEGNIVGVRLRNSLGEKWAVTGSRQGLFYNPETTSAKEMIVCEGPTDCAALLSLGLVAVGRPSCQGCEQDVASLARRIRCRQITIIADDDSGKGHNAGLRGAVKLAQHLTACHLLSRIVMTPRPFKDIRQWVTSGATVTQWLDLTKGVKFK